MSRLDHDANVRPWVQAADAGRGDGAVGRGGPGDRGAAGRSSTRPDRRAHPAGGGDRRQQRARHPAGRGRDRRAGARGRRADLRRRGARDAAHGPVDVAALGRRLLRHQRLQVVGPAHRRGGRRPGAAGDAAARTSWPPPPTTVPDRFERGTRRSPTWPGCAPPSTTWPRSTRRPPAPAGSGCWPRWPPPRRTSWSCSPCCSTAWRRCRTSRCTARPPGGPPPPTSPSPGRTPRQVAEHLAARRVNVWNGHNYAWELTGALGIRDSGGAVRAGLVHYNDRVRRRPAAGGRQPSWADLLPPGPSAPLSDSSGRAAATIRPPSRAWRRAASVSGEKTRSTPWAASSAAIARTSACRSGATSRT